MAETDLKSSANTMSELMKRLREIGAAHGDSQSLPPVEDWAPERAIDIDMEIRADGSWWHEGAPIRRDRLVRLFSTILRRDPDGTYWLVTPVEKVRVHVEDAPFIAVRLDQVGEAGPQQKLVFTTRLGDTAIAGPDHPLRVDTDTETGEPRPYVRVRGRLDARLSRPVFYDVAERVVPSADGRSMGVWSAGRFFEIGPAA